MCVCVCVRARTRAPVSVYVCFYCVFDVLQPISYLNFHKNICYKWKPDMAVLCRFNQIYIESKKIMTQFVKKGNKNHKSKEKKKKFECFVSVKNSNRLTTNEI